MDIDLDLTCNGFQDAKTVPMAAGRKIPLKVFEEVLSVVSKRVLDSALKSDSGQGKQPDVIGAIRASHESTQGLFKLIDVEEYSKILQFARDAANPKLAKEHDMIKDDIVNLLEKYFPGSEEFDKNPKEKALAIAEGINTSVEVEIESKLNALRPISADIASKFGYVSHPDPFLPKMPDSDDVNNAWLEELDLDDSTAVSLGKIMTMFVGYPLAASRKFDEIQMLFYPFNNESAGARRYTTASFPIAYANFKSLLETKMITAAGKNPKMTVSEFVKFIITRFISDVGNPVYQLDGKGGALDIASKFKKDSDGLEKGEKKKQTKAMNTKYEEAISKIYLSDGMGAAEPKFVLPVLNVDFEAVPAIVPFPEGEGDIRERVDESKTILRVHIYDSQTTPNATERFLFNVMKDGSLPTRIMGTSIGEQPKSKKPGPNAKARVGKVNLETAAELKKLDVSPKQKLETYTTGKSAKYLKGLMKSTMPNIIVGNANTPISSISVSSSTSGAANKARFVGAIKDKPGNPVQKSDPIALDDMVILPVNLSITMLGCPLWTMGNEVFVDFGTGTSLDNVYVVKSVSHTISPGKFETSLQFGYSGTGFIGSLKGKLNVAAKALEKFDEVKK